MQKLNYPQMIINFFALYRFLLVASLNGITSFGIIVVILMAVSFVKQIVR